MTGTPNPANLPISSKYVSRSNQPVTDVEREEIASQLNDVFAAGGIDSFDYRQLLDVVYAANNLGDLAPVAEVLPVKQTYQEPQIVKQNSKLPPGEVSTTSTNAMSVLAKVGLGVGGLAVVLLVLILLLLL